MRKYILLFISASVLGGCSAQFYNDRNQTSIPPKKYPIIEKIDSSNFVATFRSSDYKLNEESKLEYVTDGEEKTSANERKYPNPSSPPTHISFNIQKSDSLKFFVCNESESSCYKFQEGYFEIGSYILSIQKITIEGILVFKIEMSDTTISKKFIYIR